MSSPRVSSNFLTSCVIPPRDPKTNLPTTLLERESLDYPNNVNTSLKSYPKRNRSGLRKSSKKEQDSYQPRSSGMSRLNENYSNNHTKNDLHHRRKHHKRSSKDKHYQQINSQETNDTDSAKENKLDNNQKYNSFASMQTNDDSQFFTQQYKSCDHQMDLQNIINDDDKFLNHLQALRTENKKTLHSLEKLYSISSELQYQHNDRRSSEHQQRLSSDKKSRNSKTPPTRMKADNGVLDENYVSIERYTTISTDQILNPQKKNRKSKSRSPGKPDTENTPYNHDYNSNNIETNKKDPMKENYRYKMDKNSAVKKSKDKSSKIKLDQKNSRKSSSSSSSSLSSSSSSKQKQGKKVNKEGWKTPEKSELNNSIGACRRTLEEAMPVQRYNISFKDAENEKIADRHLDRSIHDASSEEDELDEQLKVKVPEGHVNILPDSYYNSASFRGRSSSFDVIANMWENFSIDDYVPYTRRARAKPTNQKAWSPNITIPEPFKMTLREEGKANTKSKKVEQIEREKLEKRLQEEAELQKRVHPTPVPPTTFLPLYDELREEEERKRRYIRELSKQILKSSEKPFSFMQREETKKTMKRSRSVNNIKVKQKEEKRRAQFKANPFPEKLFDFTLADKMAEQEEFRKIKIKLRSQEMLASSSLPMSMKTRRNFMSKHYPTGEKTKRLMEELKKRKQKSSSSSFRPQIHHDIPDFEVLQRKFEGQLEQMKIVNTPTVCEPFNLHTEKIPGRRSKFLQTVHAKNLRGELDEGPSFFDGSHRSYTPGLSSSAISNHQRRSRSVDMEKGSRNRSSSLDLTRKEKSPVYSHTETSRLRQQRLRESLNKTKQEELRQSIQLNKKRKEMEHLKKSVAKKALAQDPSRNRGKETREKMKCFKEADHVRRKEYQEYLEDMNDKLRTRPLLFEREAQTNARRKAQRRYEEILKDAGIEGDTLDSFLQKPYDAVSESARETTGTEENASGSDDEDDGSYIQQTQQRSEQYSDEYESDGRQDDSDESDDGQYESRQHESNGRQKESEASVGEEDNDGDKDYEREQESDDGSYVPSERKQSDVGASDEDFDED